MHGNLESRSEVAQILTQIEAEYESGVLAVSGLASGIAKHEFITHRMERIGQLHNELRDLVGEQHAIGLLVNTLENGPDHSSHSY